MIVLAVAVAGLASLFLWQYDNIKALYRGVTETEESLRHKIKENQKQVDDTLKKYQDITVRELTEDEIGSLRDGTLTEQEIIDRIVKKDQPNETQKDTTDRDHSETGTTATPPAAGDGEGKTNPAVTNPSSPNTDPPKKPDTAGGEGSDPNHDTSEANNRISLLIARMYVLKAKFTLALKTLETSVKDEYLALPESGRTSSAKRSITSKALYQVADLEEECDAEVNKIIVEIESLLKSSGQDLSLSDAIKSAYKSEKENTKAYYVNRYLK